MLTLPGVLRIAATSAGLLSIWFLPIPQFQNGGAGSKPIPLTPFRSPAKIFAATCATCHGADGKGEYQSWVNPNMYAPRVAWGITGANVALERRYRFNIRNGPWTFGLGFANGMPAFGPSVITDAEMEALIRWLIYAPSVTGGGADPDKGVPPPPRPSGHEIRVDITDEAPWFRDDNSDTRDPFHDRRRVVMSQGDFLKIVNLGRTWHTATGTETDTGFIGYAGNIEGQDVGYYYLELSDLRSGAWKYYCKLHPYMQLEVVTPDADPLPLTHVTKLPIGLPETPGVGQVWFGLQTYGNGNHPDGAIQVVNAADWSWRLIPAVGNNPHNGWFGTARDGAEIKNISMWANWHDTGVTILDADSLNILGTVPIGAANAHIQTAPGNPKEDGGDRWFVTVMGSNKVQEVEPFLCLGYGEISKGAIGQTSGIDGTPPMAPHGIWFTDDGDHFLTANTLANSMSLYSISKPWSDAQGHSGIGKELGHAATGGKSPLAASVFNTGNRDTRRYRAYSNNAGTDDISVYDVDTTPGNENIERVHIPAPLGNAAGNIALTDMTAMPMRWAHMPIQCAISPPDATEHGRYMVVCNKASFNVSVISLDQTGYPTGIYTFPCGLGAHGIAYGRKRKPNGEIAYYAYVTCTFENYAAVYDLEKLDRLIAQDRRGRAPRAFLPGRANERVKVYGYAAQALRGRGSANVPVTLFSPDARGLVHVGDIPLVHPPGTRRSYLQEHVMVDAPGFGETLLDLDLTTESGAMGVFCRPLPSPWSRVK